VILDALGDHICPSDEILGYHRQAMDGRLGVFCEAAKFMNVELAKLNRI
jgi:hypothetical protein